MKIVRCFVVPMEFAENGTLAQADLDTIKVYLSLLYELAKSAEPKGMPVPADFFDVDINMTGGSSDDPESIRIQPKVFEELVIPGYEPKSPLTN